MSACTVCLGFRASRLVRRACIVSLLALLAWGACASPMVRAQDEPRSESETAAVELTASTIEARRKQAEESPDLDEDTKAQIAELYRQAQEQLERAAELTNKAAVFKEDADQVQQRVDQIKQQLAELKDQEPAEPVIEPLTQPETDEGDSLPLVLQVLKRQLAELEHKQTQLGQILAKRALRLEELKEAQDRAEAESTARTSRREEIRSLLQQLPERVEDIARQLEAPPPPDEPPLLTLAKRTELEARRLATLNETPALQNELAKYDAEKAVDLLRLQRDLMIQQISLATREVELAEELLRQSREQATNLAVQVSAEEAVYAQPLLQTYAQYNAELTKIAQTLTPLIAEADVQRKEAQKELDELKRKFEQTKTKVENVGLSYSIGAMLRTQRAELPDIRSRRAAVRSRQQNIDEAQFYLFKYDDERSDAANTQPLIEQILAGAPGTSDQEQQELKQAAGYVLGRQQVYLDTLRGNYSTYFDTLVELSAAEQQLITLTKQFTQYIDERVLWIRSSNRLTPEIALDPSDFWFLSSARWAGVGTTLAADMTPNIPLYSAFLLALAVLLRLGFRFRREIGDVGEQVQRSSFNRYAPTLRVALLTLFIALPWPALMLFLAWRLTTAADRGDEFTAAVGYGLYSIALGFLPLELLRHVCRSQGLADAHFDWPDSAIKVLRRNLKFLMLLGLPLVFLMSTLYACDRNHGLDLLERVCFILGTVVVAIFLRRVLRPSGGVFQEYIAYHQGGWIDRLKHIWHWLGVLSPLALGVLAFVGYYYTAQQLAWRLYITAWLIIGLILARAFLLRLLIVQRRRLSIEQLSQRRAETAAGAPSEPADAGTLAPQSAARPTDVIAELRDQTEQSRRLLNTAVFAAALIAAWAAWVDVLPALSLLERWPLWTTTTTVTEQIETADATQIQTRTRDVIDHVTIADLTFALLVGVMTFVGARNIPGLTEIAVLKRLPLDNSVRYAITALVSYAIALIGVIVACNAIGLRWQQIQWIATALTFGLAFGLQEMFANFVAGIILLFERPIRVGDVVTVGDTTGIVSRIRIRATTITNWDRKEFVVPNKEFITGRLLNWTLSDKVNRVVINVGVAYGSDTEKAKELLLKVAHDHPLILKDPPTLATFEGFGDNSLNFCLRTFLPSMEQRLAVIHDLHTAIDQAFREAGIEIAFPQRDIHIRHVPESLRGPLADGKGSGRGNGRETGSGEPVAGRASED